MDNMIARRRRSSATCRKESWQLWDWEKVRDAHEREAERKERNQKLVRLMSWFKTVTILASLHPHSTEGIQKLMQEQYYCGRIVLWLYQFYAFKAWTVWHIFIPIIAVLSMDAVSGRLLPNFLRALVSKARRVGDGFSLEGEKMFDSRFPATPKKTIEKVPGIDSWREYNANSCLSVILPQDISIHDIAEASHLSLADRLYLGWHSEMVESKADEPFVVAEEPTMFYAMLHGLQLALWSGLAYLGSILCRILRSLLKSGRWADSRRIIANYIYKIPLPANDGSLDGGTATPGIEESKSDTKSKTESSIVRNAKVDRADNDTASFSNASRASDRFLRTKGPDGRRKQGRFFTLENVDSGRSDSSRDRDLLQEPSKHSSTDRTASQKTSDDHKDGFATDSRKESTRLLRKSGTAPRTILSVQKAGYVGFSNCRVPRLSRQVDFLYQSCSDLWNSASSAAPFLEFQLRRTLDEIQVVYKLSNTSIPREMEIDTDVIAEAELKLLNVAFMLGSVRDRPHLSHSRHTAVDLALTKLDLARQSFSRLRAGTKPMSKVGESHIAQDNWILAKLSNTYIKVRSLRERRLLIRDSLSLLGSIYSDARLDSDYTAIENAHRVLEARSRSITVLSSNRNVQEELRKVIWLIETELRSLNEDRLHANDFRSRADYVAPSDVRDEEMAGMTPTDLLPQSPVAHNITKASESDIVEFQHRMKSLYQSTELVKTLPEDERTAIASVLRAEIAELLAAIGAGFDSHSPDIRFIVGELISSARAQLQLLDPAVGGGDDVDNEQWRNDQENIRTSDATDDRLPSSPTTQLGPSESGGLETRSPTQSDTTGRSSEITAVPLQILDVHVPQFIWEFALRLEDLRARIDLTFIPLRARLVEYHVPSLGDEEVTSLLHRLNGHRRDVEKLDGELRAASLVEGNEHEGLQMIRARSRETLRVLCDQMIDLKRHLSSDANGFIMSDPRIIVAVNRFHNRMNERSEDWEVVNIWSLDVFERESANIVHELDRVDPDACGGACSAELAKLLTILSKLEYLKETGSALIKANRNSIQAMQTIVDVLGSIEVCSRTAAAIYTEVIARSQHGWRIGGSREAIESLQFWIGNSVYPHCDGSYSEAVDFAFSGPQALLTSLHALQVCRAGVRHEDVLRAMFTNIDQKIELESWPHLSHSDRLAEPTEHYDGYIRAFLWDIVQRHGVRSAEYRVEREKLLVCNSFDRQQLRVMLGFMDRRGFLNDRQGDIYLLGVVTRSEVINNGGLVATAEVLDPAIKPLPPANPTRTTIWLYDTNAEGRAQTAVAKRNEETGKLHRTQNIVIATWQGFTRQLRNQGRSKGRHKVKTWGLKVPSSQDDAEVPETDDEEEEERFEITEVPKEKHQRNNHVRHQAARSEAAENVPDDSDAIIKGKNGKPIEPRKDERPPSDAGSWRIEGDESLIRELEECTASGYLMGRTFPDDHLLCSLEAMLEALKFSLIEETPKLLTFAKLLGKMFANCSQKGKVPMGTIGQPRPAYAACVRSFIDTLGLECEPEDFYAMNNFSPLQLQCVLDFMLMGEDGAPSGMYNTEIDVIPQIAIITPIQEQAGSEMLVQTYRLQSSYFQPGAPTMNIWLFMDLSTHDQHQGASPVYHYRALKWQYSIMDIDETKPQVHEWGLKTERAQSQAYRLETALPSGYSHLYHTKIAPQRRKRNQKFWNSTGQAEESGGEETGQDFRGDSEPHSSSAHRASRRGESSRQHGSTSSTNAGTSSKGSPGSSKHPKLKGKGRARTGKRETSSTPRLEGHVPSRRRAVVR
ncbi:hypothetical protein AC578_522 [Pseudocercospora eumusae]|uniref:Uncharacterized protein n=1 Tax=Pseudocercospora eumusae TaxID=321146 RepID=A0A139HYP4_9PEZI|nr:hypothetical protein AC578_522 [Pseudocercospora eumusae]